MKQRYSLARRERLPFRVVSLGNITTGGTGKTPAAIALAKEALRRGLRPVILTRGYRGKAKGPCFVTKGEGPLLSAAEAGDEPYLMALRLRGVPIVKGPDRYRSGLYAIEELGYSPQKTAARVVFILDDGFQHFRLFRDRDIVLIASEDPFGGGRLLPVGRLREPAAALERAHVIVITKSDTAAGDVRQTIESVREFNSGAPLFTASHLPVSADDLHGNENPVSIMAGKRVFGFCGIGSPEAFRRTLLEAGAEIAGFRDFRDHHHYAPSNISDMAEEAARLRCEWIVTTEKDIIKIKHLDLPGNILIIRIAFSVDNDFYSEVLG